MNLIQFRLKLLNVLDNNDESQSCLVNFCCFKMLFYKVSALKKTLLAIVFFSALITLSVIYNPFFNTKNIEGNKIKDINENLVATNKSEKNNDNSVLTSTTTTTTTTSTFTSTSTSTATTSSIFTTTITNSVNTTIKKVNEEKSTEPNTVSSTLAITNIKTNPITSIQFSTKRPKINTNILEINSSFCFYTIGNKTSKCLLKILKK